MTKEKEKDEESILFPETEINGILVKPWSFGKLFEISSFLDDVITKIEEKKIDIDSDFISYITMAKIFTIANQQVLKIMEITLGMEEEKIKELPMDIGIKIAATIANQNWTIISNSLKNVLGLFRTEEKETKKPEKTEKTKK